MKASRSISHCSSVAALALLIAFAPACTSGGNVDKREKAAKTVEPTQAAQKMQAKGPQPGGHVRLRSPEPRYLNPVLQGQFDRANLLIYEGLVALDARLDPIPRLASKLDLSPDGKTLTFTLRTDVKWHDGEPFTSKDVAFTFKAIRETQVSTLWKAYMSSVESLETPDDNTVVVKYKQPYGPALNAWTVGILPQHLFSGQSLVRSKYNQDAVGTGPYKLARWEKGQRIVLQANRNWWYKEGDKKLPYIDSVELLFNISAKDTVEALANDQVDFAEIVDIDDWTNRVQSADFRSDFEASDVSEAQFRAIAWNGKKPLFADKRVRKALTHALNRGRVIDDVLLSYARPLSVPFFPTMYGADPSIAPWPFDLDKATKLLDEAGHPAKKGNPRFAIDMIALKSQEHTVTHASIGIFRNDLRAIGVELKMTHLDSGEFFDRIIMGKYDAVYFGWLPDISDPDPYGLLHSTMIGAGHNYAAYSNPVVDKLLDNARATTNRDERKAMYHKLHRILHDDIPYTTLYAPLAHYAWSRRLRGVNPYDVGAQARFPGLPRWWISNRVAFAPQAAKSAIR
ncbi:MAG: ABC transporter substrate-binding protein [Proteobacteria bacterium]|nr:ABC transporter substrate-binding protein [Pseudomonadota bacterium]